MMNNVTLIGRLTRDPEIRSTTNTQVANLSIATDRVKLDSEGRTYKEDGYTAKEVEYHRVTAFGTTAKSVGDHKSKGDMVAVEGRLHYTKWTDNGGIERYGCEVIADRIHFL
jgi:single-strand DNA-binding protein